MAVNDLGKGTFFFGQHCPVGAGTWLELKSGHFLGQNFRLLAQKSVFGLDKQFDNGGPILA